MNENNILKSINLKAVLIPIILKVLNCYCVAVKEEALDAPSLVRGSSKRSLSGVCPPYAAPLSPKHLRAEAHPSEGTAHFADDTISSSVIFKAH